MQQGRGYHSLGHRLAAPIWNGQEREEGLTGRERPSCFTFRVTGPSPYRGMSTPQRKGVNSSSRRRSCDRASMLKLEHSQGEVRG